MTDNNHCDECIHWLTRWLPWSCMTAAVIILVAGRIATWHCTEGEAMLAGWWYWCAAAGCGLIGVAMACGERSER